MAAQIKDISLVVVSAFIVVSTIKAEAPKTAKIIGAEYKHQIEAPQNANGILEKDNDLVERELNYYDIELSKMGVGTLLEPNEIPNDSTKTDALELYLQLIMPIIQKEELENIELIEIL